MPSTISVNLGYSVKDGRTILQTLTVGDRVVVESVSRSLSHSPPPTRIVAVVTRILGGVRPYMEVRRPDGRLQLFTSGGTERGLDPYRANEHIRQFVSEADEEARAEAVRQYERGQAVAHKLSLATERMSRILSNHPELIADCEALLSRIAAVTAPKP